MEKKTIKEYWERFSKTGKIEDYLRYKFAKKKEETYETNQKTTRNHSKGEGV